MTRLKSLLVTAAIILAVATLIRSRLGDARPVDRGGWKPTEPN